MPIFQEIRESVTESNALQNRGQRDISIDYLRTTLTLMVVAHHSSLAYTTFAHFDPKHMFASTAPIVDSARWDFLDYAENFNDVFFMSLMFFVSGLFVHSALKRHGTWRFVRDRFLRLGVPFIAAVTLVMPVAYYASWTLTGRNVGFADFYRKIASWGFVAGPPWFVWVLLLFDVALAFLIAPFTNRLEPSERKTTSLEGKPVVLYVVLFFASSLVYLPLLARYGFGTWTNFFVPPLSFQISRIGLYGLWFVFGYWIGSGGRQTGFLAPRGPLASNWPWWLGACLVFYNALWFVPKLPLPPAVLYVLQPSLWVASCCASCFAFLAVFRGVRIHRNRIMDSLSRSAYIMYLIHYVFVMWAQWLLLPVSMPAQAKFLIVFCVAGFLSWVSAEVLLRVPGFSRVL